jgi:hypothetical protein
MRAMLAGVTDNAPAGLAEPAGAASKINISQPDVSQPDISQIRSFAPTMRFPRMRIFLRLIAGVYALTAMVRRK